MGGTLLAALGAMGALGTFAMVANTLRMGEQAMVQGSSDQREAFSAMTERTREKLIRGPGAGSAVLFALGLALFVAGLEAKGPATKAI
jgi:hypothetical protein